jgi:hypothetical protein
MKGVPFPDAAQRATVRRWSEIVESTESFMIPGLPRTIS